MCWNNNELQWYIVYIITQISVMKAKQCQGKPRETNFTRNLQPDLFIVLIVLASVHDLNMYVWCSYSLILLLTSWDQWVGVVAYMCMTYLYSFSYITGIYILFTIFTNQYPPLLPTSWDHYITAITSTPAFQHHVQVSRHILITQETTSRSRAITQM